MSKPERPSPQPVARPDETHSPWQAAYAGLVGLWVALVLLKLGTPVILDSAVQTPANLDELRVGSWPLSWGYVLTALVFLLGCTRWRRPAGMPLWLLIAPAFWLAWQFLSASRSIEANLSHATLKHFIVCVAAYYLGIFKGSQLVRQRLFWLGAVGGFVVVLVIGWRQHFGGLEETRQLFFSFPDWQSYPPELIQKLKSERVFGTLFYPNALAGVILLFLPLSLVALAETSRPWPPRSRWVLLALITVLAIGALYWSGSKAGWLIALGQGLLAVLFVRIPHRIKLAVVASVLVLGGGGFWLRHQGYFSRGATSVSARLDYWRSAWQSLQQRPLLGSGPGTFGATYRQLKRPEAEMSRLAHNDFLQQGSDSGWPGLLAYAVWLLGGLAVAAKRLRSAPTPLALGVWIGLAGLVAQSCVEFGLYIPALAWPAFLLLGQTAEGMTDDKWQMTNGRWQMADGGAGGGKYGKWGMTDDK